MCISLKVIAKDDEFYVVTTKNSIKCKFYVYFLAVSSNTAKNPLVQPFLKSKQAKKLIMYA